ncbi:MAG: nascent polypeptide-associated complex protein [Candidatus Kariarchaeaceae archaeon]|jgi:nascent polypeptide-associated complex subunit alpha
MSKRRRDQRRAERRKQRNKGGGVGMDGMSPKDMQKALSQIDTEEIPDVVEVIVRTKNEDIVLMNPEVTIMNMGQEVWNVVPNGIEKRPLGESVTPETQIDEEPIEVDIKPEDIQLIVSTANVSEEQATEALKKSRGDIAAAIMRLK